MKSNALLKWLLIPVVLLVLFVGIKRLAGPQGGSTPPSVEAKTELTAEEMKSLGIAGDTPRDTVATLVGEVKQLRSELRSAVNENKQQTVENTRLREREGAIDQRIEDALNAERARLQQAREQTARAQAQTRTLLQDFQRRLDSLGSGAAHADLPIGLGLPEGDAEKPHSNALRWIEPQDTRPTDVGTSRRPASSEREFRFPTSFEPAADRAHETIERVGESVRETTRRVVGASLSQPIYTIPANATLMGSIAMTALIGRVPIDGAVNDPYPFKVLIGPDNLTANGIDLPDVAGAVVSGTASGDWTLSCVRGRIRSITVVFNDGAIRTVPSSAAGNGAGRNTRDADLGWLSDPYGIPCVSGERRSNAQQYLSSQMLVTAAGAGAASLIDSESDNFSFIDNGSGAALGTVGISGNEAMGRILANGVNDMSEWVNKLYGQAFAAVYVRPGAKVAVHIEQPLEIDYDPHGRRVSHRIGDSYASELD